MSSEELPLRDELYNVDQLERHARSVAAGHLLATGRTAETTRDPANTPRDRSRPAKDVRDARDRTNRHRFRVGLIVGQWSLVVRLVRTGWCAPSRFTLSTSSGRLA